MDEAIFVRRLRWLVYKRLRRVLPGFAQQLRPRFANIEGDDVHWFGLHCVERREGAGFVQVGSQCRIEGTLICHRPQSSITIGSRTSIGGASVIEAMNSVTIGDDCLISHYVTIQDHNSHPLAWEDRQHDVLNWIAGVKDWSHVEQADVVIGSRCWLGTRCIILKGVHLGEGVIVGAGAVVTKSFPAYSVIAGNPARLIRVLPVAMDRQAQAADEQA